MGHTARASRWAAGRATRRILRSIPYLGAIVVLATLHESVRRKGAVRGLADAGLDAIPYLGAAKNAAEVVRGRDFLPDRPGAPRERPAPR